MAACDGFSQIFDKAAAAEKASQMIDPISSWREMKEPLDVDTSASASLNDIFGQLHFQIQEKTSPPPPKPASLPPLDPPPGSGKHATDGGFSSKSAGSLQLCTEGLGFESSTNNVDDDDALTKGKGEGSGVDIDIWDKGGRARGSCSGVGQTTGGEFPPPIESSRVCLRSYREDGRFVLLREIRVSHEFLHASREDGRLKLHFVHPNDQTAEGEEDEKEQEEEEEEGEEEKREAN